MSAARNRFSFVGVDAPDVDGRAKVTGRARFVADMESRDALAGAILRSPLPHARIRAIRTERAAALPGVLAIATAADLAGLDPYYGAFIRDQPIFAIERVRHVGEPIAAVAACDEATAFRALAAIELDFEPLPALLSAAAALAPDAPPLFSRTHDATLSPPSPGDRSRQEPSPNVLFHYEHRPGEHAQAWAQCEHVFEDRFDLARLSHYCLEPHAAVAAPTQDGVEIWANNQDPFLLRTDIARMFRLPVEAVRFHAGLVGGGFGSKSYCKIEPIAALLALKAQRKVRLVLSMAESMTTVCEHGAEIFLRTGVGRDGAFIARSAQVILDGGAYADASPSVATRIATRFGGPYRWRALSSDVTVARTNTVPAGSFRGFGSAHVTWASESQIDVIARALAIDPCELRRRNLIPLGGEVAPGEAALDSDMAAGLEQVRARMAAAAAPPRPGRGVGYAMAIKSAGVAHRSEAYVRLFGDGAVRIASGVTEIGQAARTALVQIAAETLGVALSAIAVDETDTAHTPFDTGTHASAGVTLGGAAMRQAAEAAVAAALGFAAQTLGCSAQELTWADVAVRTRDAAFTLPDLFARAGRDAQRFLEGRGAVHTPHKSQFWMAAWTAAEVEVDVDTGAFSVTRLVTSADAGLAISPERCRSQIEGGAVQGFGQAAMEQLVDGGGPCGARPTQYRAPRMKDAPRLEAFVQEQGHGPGPYGSKGVGEAGNLTIPAAIANAIAAATGARVRSLPLTPDKVLAALDAVTAPAGGGEP